ncbi:MAG: deoxynucleoside kinase [Gammaproteobacteria bacterium]|nr:deoxynucleoside kinase [Gammaproteobacteria bacterium]
MKFNHIAVEGPIGVGKSTLAKALASHYQARFLPDTDVSNPFLKLFYSNPAKIALQTQLFFLVSRLKALDEANVSIGSGPTVADFMLEKDRLFAQLTLDETEWWMYQELFERATKDAPKPDLVVYLQAPLEVLIQRIAKRGLKHEQRIDSAYLQQLIKLYEQYFHDYTAGALLIVNAADINFADNPADLKHLLEQIDSVDSGRHFVNPAVA